MRILERSVTKPFWMKIYRLLFRAIKRGDYHTLGTSRVLCVEHHDQRRSYVIVTKNGTELRPVAWLYLWREPEWVSWEVMQVFVFEAFRGKGLAKRLYQAAINDDGIILASGATQSKSSRALWKNFISRRLFDIFAIDYMDMSKRSQVFIDDSGEIWCALDIYSESKSADVRLIATRKKK